MSMAIVGNMSIPRDVTTACYYDGFIYIIGGRTQPWVYSTVCERFDPKTK